MGNPIQNHTCVWGGGGGEGGLRETLNIVIITTSLRFFRNKLNMAFFIKNSPQVIKHHK